MNKKNGIIITAYILLFMAIIVNSIEIQAKEMTSEEKISFASEDATSKTEQNALITWDEKDLVEKALTVFRGFWKQRLEETIEGLPDRIIDIDINNVRISYIRDNPLEDGTEDDRTFFKSVYCIVDFLFYCDYYSDSYPIYPGTDNSVIVYRDGSMKASKNPLDYPNIRSYYAYDIIDHISDTGVKYIEDDPTDTDPHQEYETLTNASDQELIEKTLPILQEGWKLEMEKPIGRKRVEGLDIKNARIVYLKENPTTAEEGTEDAIETFKDISCIVEYLFFCDYFGNSYPVFPLMCDTIAVYRDGSMEMLRSNLLRQMKMRYLIMDYSGVIDHISDIGTTYLA